MSMSTDPTANGDLVDLVIFGIDARSATYDDARHRIAVLMGVPDEEVEDALAIGGRVVTAGLTREDGDAHFATLRGLGVECNLRPSLRSGRTLSLIPMSLERELACPRCGHEHVYQRDDPPPEQCASCGLVFAKFEKAQAEQAERDRIRQELLAKHGHLTEAQEREAREQADAERRARLEEEIRRELGLPKAVRSRKGLVAAVGGVLLLGIGVGVGATLLVRTLTGGPNTPTAVVSTTSSSTDEDGATVVADPALETHAVVTELDTAAPKETATPGDLASLSPSRSSPEDTLATLERDAMYDLDVGERGDALLAAGQSGSAVQLLGQSRDRSRTIRAIADAALRRATTSGNPSAVAPTLDALATSVGQMAPDSPTRIGDLAHVARAQLAAGIVDGATVNVGTLRQWADQARAPEARVQALGAAGNLLQRMGKRDDAVAAFRQANEGLRAVKLRGERLPLVLGLARSYADAGSTGAATLLVEHATRSAATIADPAQRVVLLRDVALFHAETGNASAALRAVATLERADARDDIALDLAEAMVASDRIATAAELVDAIDAPAYRSRALARLALGQKRSRSPLFSALAAQTLSMARTEADGVTDGPAKSMVLADLARTAVLIGDPGIGANWFGEAEQLAAAITDEGARNTVAAVLASQLVRAGQDTEAQRVAASITDQALIVDINDDIARVSTVGQLSAAAQASAAPAVVPVAGATPGGAGTATQTPATTPTPAAAAPAAAPATTP